MTALLFAFLLIQASPAPKGFATGLVRSANGAPAPGVRVYAIPAGEPNSASTDATVFESLAQTDASGRYSLEIPAGRYYFAVGSVSSPTYYPDTASIASARPISIVAGSTVESIDFSRYTLAAASTSPLGTISIVQPTLPPGSTGVLAGVVRSLDGTGVSGITVHAVPSSILNSTQKMPSMILFGSSTGQRTLIFSQQGGPAQQVIRPVVGVAVTDSQGRYRMENIAPDTYNIMAGYSDAPVFYPGTADSQKATAIVTAPATSLTSLDLTMPPPPPTFSIRGRVSANNDRPAGGATLTAQRLGSTPAVGAGLLLPNRNNNPSFKAGGDGTFEITDLVAGKYSLQASISGITPRMKTVELVDQSVNLDFDLSINVLSGRIVWEDGSPFSDPAIGPVALSTTSNPNFVATTLMQVSNNGAFSGVIDQGEYRFYIRSLPAGYVVRTMTIGPVDLAKDALHVSADVPDTVEVRVAKGLNPGARFSGRVLDATTGNPPTADHVELCCFTTGPFERLSAAIRPDGSFDFPQVPPGRYTADLRRNSAQATAGIVNQTIEIGDQERSSILLVSATQLSSVTATVTFEDGSNLPSSVTVTVALLVTPGTSRGTNPPNSASATNATAIPMGKLRDGTFWTPFPTGVLYTISVENLPDGYRIKSMSGPGPTSAVSVPPADGSGTYIGVAPGAVSVVLQRTPTN